MRLRRLAYPYMLWMVVFTLAPLLLVAFYAFTAYDQDGRLFFTLAGMGMPGTSGFPAELLLLLAALKTHTGAGLAALFGMVVGAGYALSLYRRVFLGPVRSPVVAEAADLRPRELLVAATFALILLVVGLWPALVLEVLRPAAEAWVARTG